MPITNRRRAPRRDGYSIAAILLLMATIAVLLGLARPLQGVSMSTEAVVNIVVSLFGGAIVGGMLGMTHERRAAGLLVGIAVGGLTGLASGAIMLAPAASLAIPLIGSVAILMFAALVRATSGPAPRADAADFDASRRPGLLPWLKPMTGGQKLSLLLGTLTGIYVAIQAMEILRSQVYLSMSQLAGRLTMLLLLTLLTFFLVWLALRKPAAPLDEAIDLTPHDIDDAHRRA